MRLLLLLLLLLALPAAVQAQFNYTDNGDGTATITGYTGSGGAVIIPDSIKGLSVTTIGDSAFYACVTISSISIPNSVTSIGNYAFVNWRLKSVTIPNSVTTVGDGVFANCSSLASVTLGNSVTSIGNMMFSNCSSLTSLMIPNSVTSIGYFAFWDCSSLSSVTIPNGVTSIGNYAFYGCGVGGDYTIPDSVTTIGDYAFYGCNLTSVTIPNGVTSIGNYAFYGCGLASVTILNSATSVGDWAFADCNSLTTVALGNSVTSIGRCAFSNTGLNSVSIPVSVTAIGYAPFQDCNSLTDIAVDVDNLDYSSIDGVLFTKKQTTLLQYPGGLSGSYTIPDTVTTIDYAALKDCNSLTSVTIPSSVTTIVDWAFAGTSLSSVTIPSSVTTIGDYTFAYCGSLTSAYFQGNAPTPGGDEMAFSGDGNATAYYFAGTSGWDTSYGGIPTVQLYPRPPVAGTVYYERQGNVSLKISTSDLLANVTNADGEPIMLFGVGTDGFNLFSTNGATLFTNSTWIFYTNSVTPNVNDSFNYTVSDGLGRKSVGTVVILMTNNIVGQISPNLTVTSTSVTANFFGVPGFQYTVERSTNLTQGLGWVAISTNTAPANGLFQVVDHFKDLGIPIPPLPSSAFYRLRYNP